MASTIKIKRSGVANKTPTTADIATGELAINYKDQKLFSSNGTAVFQIGASSGGLVSTTTKTFDALKGTDTVITGVTAAVSTNYLQVANASATYTSKAYAAANSYVKSILANTNSYIAAQATRITLVNTNLTGTNTALRTLISDRLQVANAAATYLTKNNPVVTGTLTANGSTGTAGHYLRTSGTGVYWSPISSGGSTPQIQSQLFTASGTWTAPTGVTKVKATVFGGGGGGDGGGCTYGGDGGIAIGIYTVTPGTAYTVTVGLGGNGNADGGTTSFGAFVSATGGQRGSIGGNGGAGTGGTIRNFSSVARNNVLNQTLGLPFGGQYAQSPSTTRQAWSIGSNFSPGSRGDYTSSRAGVDGIVFLEWVG